jgi:hypothetical protein
MAARSIAPLFDKLKLPYELELRKQVSHHLLKGLSCES